MSKTPTVADMKAQLRAYGLPVKGTAADLAGRLRDLDELRKTFGGDRAKIEALTVPELKRLLNHLQVKAWKFKSKKHLVESLARLTGRPTPTPEPAKSKSEDWAIEWFNPATLRREIYSDGMSRASALRLEGSVYNRVREVLMYAGKHLPELSPWGDHGEPWVRATTMPSGVMPTDSRAESDAAEAFAEIVNAERDSADPAMAGDGAGLRRQVARIERAKERLAEARARL